MIQATISWREELGVTDILSRPLDRDKMDLMAKNFLSYYAGCVSLRNTSEHLSTGCGC